MSLATMRREALSNELARTVLAREASVLRVVRDAPAALTTLREELAARVSRNHRRIGAVSREVLLVEDNDSMRASLSVLLADSLRVPVRSASTAADGRRLWDRHRCGMVVVDLHLPDQLGDDFILSLDRGVRAVLMSGVTDVVTLETAAARCHAIALQKPPDGIVDIVQKELDAVCPPFWCRASADTIIDISCDLARLIGRSPETLRGTSWRSMIHPDDLAASEAERARRMGLGVEGFVQRMRRADGGYVTLRWNVTPMVDGVVYAVARVV